MSAVSARSPLPLVVHELAAPGVQVQVKFIPGSWVLKGSDTPRPTASEGPALVTVSV